MWKDDEYVELIGIASESKANLKDIYYDADNEFYLCVDLNKTVLISTNTMKGYILT